MQYINECTDYINILYYGPMDLILQYNRSLKTILHKSKQNNVKTKLELLKHKAKLIILIIQDEAKVEFNTNLIDILLYFNYLYNRSIYSVLKDL